MPEPFPVKITPRSTGRAELLTREWKRVEEGCLDPENKQWKVSPIPSRARKV